MPTFFNPGGRTFAGGDMMPCLMFCPNADAARSNIAAIVRIVWILLTAYLSLPWLVGEASSSGRKHSLRLRVTHHLVKSQAGHVAPASPWPGRSESAPHRCSYQPSRSSLKP